MIGLGSLSFAVPWALAALAALPAIWWLLRLKPPALTRIPFSSVFLLRRLSTREESPANTPIWLLFLRMLLASAVIVAAARPMLSAESPLHGRGPLYVIIDDGWAAAANWPARQAMLMNLADQADRADRPIAVITTAAVAG
ncbi:MAG: BatA domain-containing protein, partial [Rhodospirillales bacterium]